MFGAGLRAQFTAARLAAPLMIERGRGLIVCTAGNDDFAYYLGNVPYDVVKAASVRFVTAIARELQPHGVAAVGVYPGFTRTEAVVDAFAAGGQEPPDVTHSPEFVGRAVAHLLADQDVFELSGSGAQAAVVREALRVQGRGRPRDRAVRHARGVPPLAHETRPAGFEPATNGLEGRRSVH